MEESVSEHILYYCDFMSLSSFSRRGKSKSLGGNKRTGGNGSVNLLFFLFYLTKKPNPVNKNSIDTLKIDFRVNKTYIVSIVLSELLNLTSAVHVVQKTPYIFIIQFTEFVFPVTSLVDDLIHVNTNDNIFLK